MSGHHPSLRSGREERWEACPERSVLLFSSSGLQWRGRVSDCRGSVQEPLGPELEKDHGPRPVGKDAGCGIGPHRKEAGKDRKVGTAEQAILQIILG